MELYDDVCRQLEAILAFAMRPFGPLLARVNHYMMSNDSSPLGQTLIVCSPMLISLLLICIVIDLR